MQIADAYVPGMETSFTIIAFPLPEIGDNFEKIFEETIRINTLDYELYRDIQQCIIDALDQAVRRVDGNRLSGCDQLVRLLRHRDRMRAAVGLVLVAHHETLRSSVSR